MDKCTTCSVEGCGKAGRITRGWCSMHYQRWKAHGDPLFERPPVNVGGCGVEGCDGPARKRGWCESHYSQWRRERRVGELAFRHAQRSPCLVCGADTSESPYRAYCSDACYVLLREHGGKVPKGADCVWCGAWVSFLPEHNGGARKKASTKSCPRCRRSRLTVTVQDLAERDGAACGICGEAVDMSLPSRSAWGPTRDHIKPWSLGGSDDPENLRLAHSVCNIRRGNRLDPVPA